MYNTELISVIIPVYNVERYLERCVKSVMDQTYKNLEIILVDDGSPDNSGKMCDELSKLDDRIVVYHKENGGLSDARNYGVERAKGKYIGFVDSDDYIHENMYAHLYEVIKKEDADVSECGVTRVYKNFNRPHYMGEDFCELLDSKRYLEEYLKIDKVYGSVWCKLIKKEVAEKLSFPVGKIYEDLFYNYGLIQLDIKIAITNKSYYYYYIRKGSITTEQFNRKHLSLLEILGKFRRYVEKNYPEFSNYAIVREVYGYLSILNQIIMLNDYKNNQDYKNIKGYLKTNFKNVIKMKEAPKSLKLGLVAFSINEKLYKYILSKYKSKAIENE